MPRLLRKAGYQLVTHKTKYKGRQGVKDPTIIADCGKAKLILLTADNELETLWAAEIQASRIAVVILANNKDGSAVWGTRLGKGRDDILLKLRTYKEPFALRFGVNARVTHVRLYGPKRARLIAV